MTTPTPDRLTYDSERLIHAWRERFTGRRTVAREMLDQAEVLVREAVARELAQQRAEAKTDRERELERREWKVELAERGQKSTEDRLRRQLAERAGVDIAVWVGGPAGPAAGQVATCPTSAAPARGHRRVGAVVPAWVGDLPMRCPTYVATETEFTVMSTEFAHQQPRLWEALNEWCRFHDVDPERVPLLSTLRRDVEGRRVHYTEVLVAEDGRKQFDRLTLEMMTRPAYSQGEGPPLPFPTLEAPVLAVPS